MQSCNSNICKENQQPLVSNEIILCQFFCRRYNGVIQWLYAGIQCSSCGLRFIAGDNEKYREHLDWHFRQNKKDKEEAKVVKFKRWYYDTSVSSFFFNHMFSLFCN